MRFGAMCGNAASSSCADLKKETKDDLREGGCVLTKTAQHVVECNLGVACEMAIRFKEKNAFNLYRQALRACSWHKHVSKKYWSIPSS
jgi:hypothetical protein